MVTIWGNEFPLFWIIATVTILTGALVFVAYLFSLQMNRSRMIRYLGVRKYDDEAVIALRLYRKVREMADEGQILLGQVQMRDVHPLEIHSLTHTLQQFACMFEWDNGILYVPPQDGRAQMPVLEIRDTDLCVEWDRFRRSWNMLLARYSHLTFESQRIRTKRQSKYPSTSPTHL